jgi:acetyl esterase/lipase
MGRSKVIRFYIVTITLLAAGVYASAQGSVSNIGTDNRDEVITLEIWPKSALDANASIETERPEPDRGDNVIRISNITDPTIMIFKAKQSETKRPAKIICPGGGYSYLAVNKEGTKIADWFNSLGITSIVLKYRVPNQRDNAFKDIQRAMRVVRFNANEWNVDPDKIGVIGFSAGAHLCARLSSDFDNKSYESVDEQDALSCRPDFTTLLYPAYLSDSCSVLRPDIKVSSKNPSAFIVQTQDDSVGVENSLYYYIALKNANVSSELHIFPSGGHGYGMEPNNASLATWPELCEKWLCHIAIIGQELQSNK